MSQNEPARLHDGQENSEVFFAALREWKEKHSDNDSDFSEDEMDLQRAVALVYADARRPSIRQLYRVLTDLIEDDAMRTGLQAKCPSLEEFRSLILSLPSAYVDHMRYQQKLNAFELIKSAETLLDRLAA
ncbi:hypothetical protein HJA95_14315 [Rhizobium binae]|uniref:hypothetical protein n=1 Tax=Rhizobium binae TaxID=1138190 RepID=UPI001C83EEEA|nr:hypothetical protein [Rhizobium binae]MBX4950729.1 hypothetical protein [Rhizobium binae]